MTTPSLPTIYPTIEKGETDRHFELVNAVRLANQRISELESQMTELHGLVLELTSSQNQWASQAAEQARRVREKVRNSQKMEHE